MSSIASIPDTINGYSRLEAARFFWPKHLAQGSQIVLNGQQLNWLLDGFNLRFWKPHPALHYQGVA